MVRVISYTLQRLLQAIPVLMMISLITFFLVSSVDTGVSEAQTRPSAWPTEPELSLSVKYLHWIAGVIIRADGSKDDAGVDPTRCARIARLEFAFCDIGGGVIRADLGISTATHQPVWRRISQALSATLGLAGMSFGLGSIVGLSLMQLGYAQPALARLVDAFSRFGKRISLFWLGLMVLFLFAVHQAWLTSTAFERIATPTQVDLTMQIRPLLPAVSILALLWMALLYNLFDGDRPGLSVYRPLREYRKRSGTRRWLAQIRSGHDSPQSFLAAIGAAIGHLLAATIIVETFFGWPGLGYLTLQATIQRDYPVVLGMVMVTATLVLLGQLLLDVICTSYQPQTRSTPEPQVRRLEPMQK
jgi:peptide/nickel transport system permease protein